MNTNIKSKKLISYKDLEKEFGTRVSPKCKKQLGDKIFDDYPQRMIKTALEFNDFTDAEYWELSKRGRWKKGSEYPGLHYLCTVFIHPLTYLHRVFDTAEKCGVPIKLF